MPLFIKGASWKPMTGVAYTNWLNANTYKFSWITEFLVPPMRK